MLGRRRRPPTALRMAAAQPERGEEVGARSLREQETNPQSPSEHPPFALQQVRLERVERGPDGRGAPADEAIWRSYELPTKRKRRRRRAGGIAVGSIATRLIQRERAGGRKASPVDPRASALERAARHWQAEATRTAGRTAGDPARGGR